MVTQVSGHWLPVWLQAFKDSSSPDPAEFGCQAAHSSRGVGLVTY